MTAPAWYSRARVDGFVHSRGVQNTVIAVILVNAAILGLETVPALHAGTVGDALRMLDKVCLGIFVVEILLKLYAQRLGFFRSAWNVFDFVVVGISLVPGADGLAVLRALRVLRVLRLVSAVPALRRVVDALVRAIPGIGAIAALLAIVFYVGAVMATTLFGARFPDEFGDMGRSLFTLFQVMTLDNWSVAARDVWEAVPWAPAFFVPFVLVSSLTVLNLFIAVIVDAMQGLNSRHRDAGEPAEHADPVAVVAHDASAERADVAAELAKLRAEVADLSALLRAKND